MDNEVFEAYKSEIEELLRLSSKIENLKLCHDNENPYGFVHKYAKSLCEELLEDVKKIGEKYEQIY